LPNTSKVEGRSEMPALAASALVDLQEEPDALGGEVLFEALDRLADQISASHLDDAIAAGCARES